MMDTELFAIQTKLKALGHDPGAIDGVWGNDTRRAVAAALGITVKVAAAHASPDAPWFDLAQSQIGVKEAPGAANTLQVIEYFQGAAKLDSVPWCAAFVGWCLDEAGYRGTGSLMARSYLEWGIKLTKPQRGCVVVFKRGVPPAGHVGFVDSFNASTVMCLGGNQSDAVTVTRFPRSSVLGFRWPSQAAA
jgi:uncharacterized protein (TIGR02594 family)